MKLTLDIEDYCKQLEREVEKLHTELSALKNAQPGEAEKLIRCMVTNDTEFVGRIITAIRALEARAAK